MPVTLDQIPAYLRQRVGFWAQVTGRSADELLRGFQFEILLLESVLDKMGGTGRLQPLPQPGQTASSASTKLLVQTIVPFDVIEVATGRAFCFFTPGFNGSAVIFIAMSAGGIITLNITNSSGNLTSNPLLFSGNDIGTNLANADEILISAGLKYSLSSSIAGTATFYVLCWPGL